MPIALRMPLLLAIALLLGIALWGGKTAAAHTSERAAAVPPLPPGALLADGSERDLVRALLVLLSAEQRATANVASAVTSAVFVGREVPPGAISHGGGVVVSNLDAGSRALVQRLFAHAVALAAPHRPDPATPVPELSPEAAFAFAGDATAGNDLYLRWHLRHAVCEWVGFAGGDVHARWRDFGDAHTPWLGVELARRLSR